MRRLLTITKKCEERKDGGMAARQSVPFARVQCITIFRWDTGCQELLCKNCGYELLCQSYEFCFEGFCHLFCPRYQFYEEFPDHCNKNIKFSVAYRVIWTTGVDECLVSYNSGWIAGIFWKIIIARLNFFENLHWIMNLMVKWDLGGGGCGKVEIFFLNYRNQINSLHRNFPFRHLVLVSRDKSLEGWRIS